MNVWTIALRSLLREWRAGDLRIVAFALIVATAGLVSVASFGDRLNQTLVSQGSELLGADLVVHVQSAPNREWIERADENGLTHAQTVSFRSVVVAGDQTQLAEIKAVEAGYPLRGTLRIADALGSDDYAADGVPERGSVWADAQLLNQLRLEIGDEAGLGQEQFPVTKLVTLEPDRGGVAFTLAPRLMLNLEDLPATGLVQPGSLVHYHWLVAGSADRIQGFKQWLMEQGVVESDLRGVDDAQPRFRMALDRGQRFLLLATLVSVLLAGIAIATSIRHYVRRQWDSVAIMRCFGAKQRDIVSIYATQLLVLAIAASLVGAGIGLAGQEILVKILTDLVSGELPLPTYRPVLQGLLVGVITVLGFGLPSLVRLKDVPPMRVIRRDLGVLPASSYIVYGVAFLVFAILVAWVAGELPLTLWVLGGTVLTLLILAVVSHLLIKILGRIRSNANVTWRFGISSLARRARSSTSQIVVMGVGIMAMLLLTIVRNDLWEQWQVSLPAETPNHFLINIQPDQLRDVDTFFKSSGLPAPRLTPIVRARLVGINGRTVAADDFEDGFAKRQVQRAANLSWAESPQSDNEVIRGRWWAAEERDLPLLSVERDYAEALGLDLGDELTYRIADEELTLRISNLRRVGWDSFRPNFFLIVPPGLLKGFPASYITSLYLPRDHNDKIKAVIKRFPNITDIDVDALIAQVRRVLNKVNSALQFIFIFTVAAGIVVLWAALNSSRAERRKEIAVLRVLGAKSRDIRSGFVAEFVLLGFLSGLVGASAAAGFGYGLSRFVFDLPYQANVLLWVAGATLAVTMVVGASFMAIRGDLKSVPWQTLRETE
jgi:putative ABC transport system permease protein